MRPSHSSVLLLVAAYGVAVCWAAPAPGPAARLVVSSVGEAVQADMSQQAATDQTGVKTPKRVVGMGMSMQMTFFGGNTFDLWFNAFHIHNAGTLAAGCLGVAIMAALYEGLKVYRIILADRIDSSSVSSMGHWIQVLLHIIQVTCSYFLMLATMTYSTWIMVAVCAGAGLGYAIFSTMVPRNKLFGGVTEHCH